MILSWCICQRLTVPVSPFIFFVLEQKKPEIHFMTARGWVHELYRIVFFYLNYPFKQLRRTREAAHESIFLGRSSAMLAMFLGRCVSIFISLSRLSPDTSFSANNPLFPFSSELRACCTDLKRVTLIRKSLFHKRTPAEMSSWGLAEACVRHMCPRDRISSRDRQRMLEPCYECQSVSDLL